MSANWKRHENHPLAIKSLLKADDQQRSRAGTALLLARQISFSTFVMVKSGENVAAKRKQSVSRVHRLLPRPLLMEDVLAAAQKRPGNDGWGDANSISSNLIWELVRRSENVCGS